jgi:hypothetical protein
MSAVNSYNLNTDLVQHYTVFEATDPQQTTNVWEWKSQRQVDAVNKNMHLSMNIQETPDFQTFIFQQYLAGGVDYYSQSSPVVSGPANPWTKSSLAGQGNNLWSNFTQKDPLLELLKSSADFQLNGAEQINGIDCYVIQFKPTAEAAVNWILAQSGFPGPSLGWWIGTAPERVKQIDVNAYQNGSVQIWIGKNDNLIYKAGISINLDAEPGNILLSDTGLGYQGDPTDVGFEKILRDFTGDWEFSAYDQPVAIQVPQEALDTPNNP